MLKPIMFFVTFLFYTCVVSASDIKNNAIVGDWTVDGVASTYLLFVENNEVKYHIWSAVISSSYAGETRIYFRIEGNLSACNKDLLPKVLEINGRQVAVNGYCNIYNDSSDYYVSLTPSSDEGLDYVIKTFKESSSDKWVRVRGFGETLGTAKPFSAKGFTKAFDLNRVL